MKRFFLLKLLAAFAVTAAISAPPLAASDAPNKPAAPAAAGKLVPVDAKTDATWLARAKAAYPLESCVVSNDKFEGSAMGAPKEYVYQEAGKPDRLVRFCCKDCVTDFTKDPAQYLKKIDAAVAAKSAGAKK